MAFLAPLIPFVLEGAAEVGAVATEITGSEFIGGAVKGAAVGYVGSNLENFATQIIGKENIDSVEKEAQKVKSTGLEIIGRDPFNPQVGITVHQSSGTSTDPRARRIIDTAEAYKPTMQIDANYAGRPVVDLVNLKQQRPKKYTDLIVSDKPIENPVNPVNPVSNPVNPITQQETKPNINQVSYDLGLLTGAMNNAYLREPKANDQRIFTVLEQEYPALSYLLKPVFNSTTGATKPSDEEYNKIASVYNGKSINLKDFRYYKDSQGNTIFELPDETGKIQRWSTAWNTYKVVPTIWGNWTGINSKNDAPPISLLDAIAFLHDVDYHNMGSFHKEADYKLISRINQNMDRMSLVERPYAKVAMQYFTNAGHILRYFTDHEGEISNERIEPNILPDVINNSDISKEEVMQGFLDSQSTTSSMQTLQSVITLQKIDGLMIQIV